MKQFVKLFCMIAVSTLFFINCTKDQLNEENFLIEQPLSEIKTTDGMTILGKQLENPYSVSNMRQAFTNLMPATRSGIDGSPIEPTHYYVKFCPKNENELSLLKQDSTLIFYSYPLDYDIEVHGTYYHDPEIPDSLPTYQYASIDIDKWKTLSETSVKYTVLEELFIPDEEKDDVDAILTRSGKTIESGMVDALVDEALRLTGNDDLQTAPITRGRKKWRPAGKITVYDDIAGQIPLKGAKVRARRWFTTHTGYTNSSGYYTCNGTFKRGANYSIVWESNRWDIRNGWILQAYYNGPTKTGNWDLYINSGKSLRYATIHRAAYRYYFESTGGFTRPANFRKEKICYLDKNGTGDYWGNIGVGILPDIRIYGKSKGNYKNTALIYRTTIHELAHAAHCTWMTKIQYWQVSKIIYESWADFVEWSITNLEYNTLNQNVYVENHQAWPIVGGDLAYSSLFIDLVDTYNQGAINDKLPFDEVSGFSNNILNMLLLDSYGLASLKENVKKWKPYNVTNSQIDNLFKKYEETKWK